MAAGGETEGIVASRCSDCGHESFPQRLWCPVCHSYELVPVSVTEGTLQETTVVRRAVGGTLEHTVTIGTVHATGGAVLVARIDGDLTEGDPIELRDDHGAPVARRK
jgi:uncharacterized OB-fold protein